MQQILLGDCIEQLKTLESESIQTCITSPPYWGLRDYGMDGQLGQEDTPEEFVANLVNVFREVRRVLKDDGTLWLNLGDSYAGSWGNQGRTETRGTQRAVNGEMMQNLSGYGNLEKKTNTGSWVNKHPILKPKDLIGIPWRVAFALQADGWYLRQDIIWNKPNPMPESIRDRCTKAHEYIYLLSKSPKYYFDHEAIKEPAVTAGKRKDQKKGEFKAKGEPLPGQLPFRAIRDMRNKRSVWTVTTKPFKGAHFATFPMDLIEPCVLAGAPKEGVVLDPFLGSGTTGLVAKKNGRSFVGIELNPEYMEIAKKRLELE
jgi:DNA modification methylase